MTSLQEEMASQQAEKYETTKKENMMKSSQQVEMEVPVQEQQERHVSNQQAEMTSQQAEMTSRQAEMDVRPQMQEKYVSTHLEMMKTGLKAEIISTRDTAMTSLEIA